MNRLLYIFSLVLAACSTLAAQDVNEDYLRRYKSLVKNVGVDGVGVETLIQRWEDASPDDPEMLSARFNYYIAKSQSVRIEEKQVNRFMGQKPTLTLKDSLGMDVNYFQETFYDDSLFALASSAIDKAIRLSPNRLDLRFAKINSLLYYEKESPDMTFSALSALIDYNGTSSPEWTYNGEPADKELFKAGIQEYCLILYSIASPRAFESFLSLSEKMLVWNPGDPLFMDNIGTYWLIAQKDSKQALKWYNKVLKKHPDDYTAIKNCVIMARNEKNEKLERKYLPALIRNAADDAEKLSSQARLDYLTNGKSK